MTNIHTVWSTGRPLSCILLVAVFQAISGQIRYSIPEELQKGSFVGEITKDLGIDLKQLSRGAVQIITEGKIQYFALNFQNGHLYINERVDREEICRRLLTCLIKLEILVQEQLKIYTAEIEIEDINDNAPAFQVEMLQLNIPESSTTGSRFLLPDAQDPDLGVNSLQSYQINPNRHFSLDVQMTASGTKYAELVLKESMDREEEAFHDLILTASDGGIPVKSATVHIKVIVEDANDNVPVFSQSVYKVTVEENLPIDSLLITINATDLDEGINSEITYTFRQISEKASKIFQLDSKTGEVILRQPMDFEQCTVYEMEVQARDGRGLSGRANILLAVTDVNDNTPEIAVTSLTNVVSEDSPVGIAIALVKVVDRDSGEDGEVICSILGNPPFHLQKTFDNYYSLILNKALDREETSDYNVTITATDKGTPPLSTIAIIPLKILDKNDNPPAFKEKSYISSVSENTPAGTSIIKLKANDPDWEENSRIIYSIIEGKMNGSLLSSFLSINSETGVVYALCSFDYEQIQKFHFWVKAQDGGSPPLSSNVSVTLFILDQNDNAPQILYPSPPTDGSTGIELAPRSSEPGYLVTKVVAVDADSGQNAWLSYQLTKATEPGLFTLGLHTGEIRTARFLLEKDVLKQSLVVLVKDNGQPTLSASVTVTVLLADSIPDILTDLSSISAPIDPPSDLTFYLVVAVAFVSCIFLTFLLVLLAIKVYRWRSSQLCHNGSVNLSGVPVSQFVGIDGVRAFLQSYCHEVSLTSGSRRSQILFPIGSCTNTLTSQQAPSKPDPLLVTGDSNNFKEDASDSQLNYGQVHYSIPEEVQKGSFVGNIAEDLGLSSQELSASRFRIISEGMLQYFILNFKNGHLYVSEKIDRDELCGWEEKCILSLEILVEDIVRIFTVEIEITDINDNAPTFAQERLELRISETANVGTHFPLQEAQDADSGNNSLQNYHLSSSKYFSLKLQRRSDRDEYPELVLVKSLDREEEAVHFLILTATDGGHPVKSGTVQICIVVLDANDNAPVFSQPAYQVSILESVPIGYLLVTVNATDGDEGINAEVIYSFLKIKEKTAQPFQINSRSGEITTTGKLDYEEITLHEIDVQAKDNGGLSDRAKVLIKVIDINDNIPKITVTTIFNSISEGSSLGTVVALLNIQDRDMGENGEVICSIPTTLPFHLQKSFDDYYHLVTDRLLDREDVQNYSITITATDKGSPPLSASAMLFLEISDVNDNAPIFRIDGVRAFLQSYCHEVSLTSGSRRSQIFFPIGSCTNTLTPQQAPRKPDPLLITGDSNNCKEDTAVNEVKQSVEYEESALYGIEIPGTNVR
ncbi:hypothetical protein JD844_017100 [Phrynosoma platyrhinos]|uniref:Cadherin domain-containing protein n=1 Tax=Phrynosoma platyrhinos TaxID=52577 RepID=A0ABQ7SLC3_PHRPL|nr:hypothetical protein JD844_017100 [Phrynosoma platyrhinos]